MIHRNFKTSTLLLVLLFSCESKLEVKVSRINCSGLTEAECKAKNSKDALTVELASTSTEVTAISPIPISATFSSAVADFVATDVTVTNGVVDSFTGSDTDYSFKVIPVAAGTVTVAIAADVAQNVLKKKNLVATTLTRTFQTTDTATPVAKVDSTSPTPGTFSATTSVTSTGLTLNWSAATDETTAISLLTYAVCEASTSAAIDTIAECEAATLVMPYTANTLTLVLTGKASNTTYYYNIVAKDAAGNKSIYGGTSQLTVIANPSVAYSYSGAANNNKFGHSVASVGDINRDGKDDFAIGEPYAASGGTNRGAAYVYSGATGAIIYTLTGTENNGLFGYSVDGTGDVDADGYADFMVGEPFADGAGTDRGKIYIYSGKLGTVIHTITGAVDSDSLGYTVKGLGDVNADGRSDFMAGAQLASGGGTLRGKVVVYSGANAGVLYTYNGTTDFQLLGLSISGAGDVNGDTRSDFIIGDYTALVGGVAKGIVTVYSGATGVSLFTLSGDELDGAFGFSVAGVGDVNHDGKADILIGQSSADAGGTGRGKAYVHSGADASLLFTILGSEDGGALGSKVSKAGDINNDGKADFMISESGADNGGTNRGTVRLYSGANASVFYTFLGTESSSGYGASISGGGDFNGDGKSDFMIGQNMAAASGTNRGTAYVYHSNFSTLPTGSLTASTTILADLDTTSDRDISSAAIGDVNADGYTDYAIGESAANSGGSYRGKLTVYSGLTNAVIHAISGTTDGGYFGNSVAPAGDINQDGKADFIVGEFAAPAGGVARGKAYVYSGANAAVLYTISGTSNLSFLGAAVHGGEDVNGDGVSDFIVGAYFAPGSGARRGTAVVYSGATGTAIYSLTGSEDNEYFGIAVALIGDINLDGRSDFAVGSPGAASGGTGRGKFNIYSGATGTALYTITGTENSAKLGQYIAKIGDVNRDGKPDVLVSEPLADAGGTDRGKVYVYSGATGTVLNTFTGTNDNATLGSPVAGAGDVNGDGKPDYIIGEYLAHGAGTSRGNAYVYSGVDGSLLHSFAGSQDNQQLGYGLGGGGDFNGDGKADFIVGSLGDATTGANRTRATVYLSPSN
jgi:hypothetical protein